jgi:hypothetical protein
MCSNLKKISDGHCQEVRQQLHVQLIIMADYELQQTEDCSERIYRAKLQTAAQLEPGAAAHATLEDCEQRFVKDADYIILSPLQGN